MNATKLYRGVDIYGPDESDPLNPPDLLEIFRELRTLKEPVTIIGIYLRHCPPPPNASGQRCGNTLNSDAWIRELPNLRRSHWGFIPVFCGSQVDAGANHQCPPVTSEQADTIGRVEGKAACDLMMAGGFKKGSIVYFDIESQDTSAASPAYAKFLKAWASAVRANGFNPGIYCFAKDIDHYQDCGFPFCWTIASDRIYGHASTVINPNDPNDPQYEAWDLSKHPVEKGAIATQYAFDFLISGVKSPIISGYDSSGFRLTVSRVEDPSNKHQVCLALGLDPDQY